MANPIVAIVGRPNVGKSTLFNKITGRKISIVENKPGVTRDRIFADAEWCGKPFSLVDTGGLELKSADTMWKHIKTQVEIAIDTADVIIFVVDYKTGLGADDYEVADKLRKSRKPVVLAVNKIDNYSPDKVFDFYELALGEPFAVSGELGQGIGDLLDEVCANFPEGKGEETEDIKVAVVGKPNVGKSSLCNKLLGYERTIVSNVAGTTRDAIDTPVTVDGVNYTLIDTAGIRKKRAVDEDVEYYSVLRSLSAIRRADVCVAMVDAKEGITEQDTKICGYIHEQGKPCVVVVNKWDLIEKDTNTVNKFNKDILEDLKFMDYVKTVFVSVKEGIRVNKILALAKSAYDNANKRVQTGALNNLITESVALNEPPTYQSKRLKIFYSTEVSVCPPTFVFFVNDTNLLHFSYKRYLENCIRKTFDFSGTPIRLVVRTREEDEK